MEVHLSVLCKVMGSLVAMIEGGGRQDLPFRIFIDDRVRLDHLDHRSISEARNSESCVRLVASPTDQPDPSTTT